MKKITAIKISLLISSGTVLFYSCKKNEEKVIPNSSFTSEKSSYYLTEPVSFKNTSTNASTFQWDFGDNSTSTDANPSHSYQSSGVYTVKLNAGTSTFQKKIKINTGAYSYQVKNETTISLPLSSYYYDGSVKDLINHGTVQVNGITDTVYTNRDKMELGGTLLGKTFITVTSYPLSKFSNKVLIINGSTQIFTNSANTPIVNMKNQGNSLAQLSIKTFNTH